MTLCAAFPLDLCDVGEESPEESEESAGGPEHIVPNINQREGALINRLFPLPRSPREGEAIREQKEMEEVCALVFLY